MAPDRASEPQKGSQRLFVAIEIPVEAKGAVTEAIEPIRAAYPARWSPPEHWHVTLKFLGPTPARRVDRVLERLGAVAADAVVLRTRVRGLGCFPRTDRARVLWAGLDDRPGRMAELALGLDVALSPEYHPETRPFQAHLTLARSDPPLNLAEAIARTPVESAPFTVGELVLFRSHLGRGAPRYEVLSRIALRG